MNEITIRLDDDELVDALAAAKLRGIDDLSIFFKSRGMIAARISKIASSQDYFQQEEVIYGQRV